MNFSATGQSLATLVLAHEARGVDTFLFVAVAGSVLVFLFVKMLVQRAAISVKSRYRDQAELHEACRCYKAVLQYAHVYPSWRLVSRSFNSRAV